MLSSSMIPHRSTIARALGAVLTLVVLLAALPAAAQQQHARGFVPPPDWERILEERQVILPTDKDPLPTHYDWRVHDGVTVAKDQGSCGSCWAFAATGEMEAKIKIYYGLEINLSEQQIVSCNPYGAGCDGGWAGAAYYVFMHYGGILENCMPYQGSDLVACRQDDYLEFTTMDTWNSIANDVTQIKTAVFENGPVCTSVDANGAWDGYTGGVIDVPGAGTNHLVLIVGWDDRLGSDGAWIIKNSWGLGWGESGYGYVAYGACNIGQGVTSLSYTPPPSSVTVAAPAGEQLFFGETSVTIDWSTGGDPVDTVDLYYGTGGACQDQPIVTGLPNTGSYEWLLPNVTTERATVLVFPSAGTLHGYGFSDGEFSILGHQTRYVSLEGSDQPPYDTPAKAAHSIADAVLAGAGRDTIRIAGGEYLESGITVNSQAHLEGGWSPDFAVHDPQTYPTRLRGTTGTLRFNQSAADYCGVSHITFHDCRGSVGSVPVNGRHGAAIIAMNSSPVIEHCEFVDNRAETGTGIGYGGSILAYGGSPVIRDCRFRNSVASRGGAIALAQCTDAQITDCEFTVCATSDSTSSDYLGGAVYVEGGSAALSGGALRLGAAGAGGGLAAVAGATVALGDLEATGNRAVLNGGGFYAAAADLALQRVTVTGNSCWTASGGGLYASDGVLGLCNVELRGNSTPALGGGLYAQNLSGGELRNLLLHGNQGANGGGAFLLTTGPVTFASNAITANTGGGVYLAGPELVSECNLAYGNAGGDFLTGQGSTDLVADPLYGDAAAGDFLPAMHSPLLDTGSQMAGGDWDGGRADRGLFGGPDALPSGPGRVGGLVGSLAGDQLSLFWETNPQAASYVVYCDSAAIFVPAADKAVATLDAAITDCVVTVPDGDWYFLVGAVDAAGHAGGFSERYETGGGTVPVSDGGPPAALAITAVAPNPFNPRTTVSFALPATGPVRLQVFDLRGRLVRTLHDGELSAGRHTALWNGVDRQGRPVATGVYFLRLEDGRQTATTKAVLAK